MPADGLDAVADELYSLAPAEFVSARNAKAKAARAGGDRDLAAAIAALGKPTKVAWLANQLVRQHRDDVQPLLELGAGLREATAALSGEELRRLTKAQHQLVYALVQQAKSGAGGPVTQDVADGLDRTLRAALADSDLADRLLQGRLTDGLEFSGFGGSTEGASTEPVRPALSVVRTPAPSDGRAKAEAKEAARRQAVELATRALDDARTAATAAESKRTAALAAVAESEGVVSAADQQLERLHAELDQAKVDRDAGEQALRAARKVAEVAERAARGAHRRLEAAQAALDDVGGPTRMP